MLPLAFHFNAACHASLLLRQEWRGVGDKRQTESAASLWQPVALLAANQSRAHSADQVEDQAAAASGSMH